jgi:hypothetical protein
MSEFNKVSDLYQNNRVLLSIMWYRNSWLGCFADLKIIITMPAVSKLPCQVYWTWFVTLNNPNKTVHLHCINKQLLDHKNTRDSQLLRRISKKLFIGFMYNNNCYGSCTVQWLQTPQKIFLEFTAVSAWQG